MPNLTITDEKPDVIDLHGNPAQLPKEPEPAAPQPSVPPEIQQEIQALMAKGIPIEKVLKAIEKDPRIADKVAAQSLTKK